MTIERRGSTLNERTTHLVHDNFSVFSTSVNDCGLDEYQHWIGAQYTKTLSWRWLDGSEFIYTAWAERQPWLGSKKFVFRFKTIGMKAPFNGGFVFG